MNEESFCSKCVIYWMVCYSGTGNIPQIISDTTGCIVYAPLGKVNSSSALTESNPLNARVYDKNGGRLSQDKSFKKFIPR